MNTETPQARASRGVSISPRRRALSTRVNRDALACAVWWRYKESGGSSRRITTGKVVTA